MFKECEQFRGRDHIRVTGKTNSARMPAGTNHIAIAYSQSQAQQLTKSRSHRPTSISCKVLEDVLKNFWDVYLLCRI